MMFGFSQSSTVTATPHAYHNFLNKGNNPFLMQMPNCSSYPSIFVNACENLVMVDDVVTPLNPPIAPIEEEKLEETLFDVNVSQRSHEEETSRKVVHAQVDCSAWDHQLSPNPHALAIYLEFVPARGATLERFEECQCEDDNVRFHCRTWVPGDGHYRWLQGPINLFSMEHRAKYLTRTIRCILEFLQL
jgi:hypothetical protein